MPLFKIILVMPRESVFFDPVLLGCCSMAADFSCIGPAVHYTVFNVQYSSIYDVFNAYIYDYIYDVRHYMT